MLETVCSTGCRLLRKKKEIRKNRCKLAFCHVIIIPIISITIIVNVVAVVDDSVVVAGVSVESSCMWPMLQLV